MFKNVSILILYKVVFEMHVEDKTYCYISFLVKNNDSENSLICLSVSIFSFTQHI